MTLALPLPLDIPIQLNFDLNLSIISSPFQLEIWKYYITTQINGEVSRNIINHNNIFYTWN